MKDAVEPGPCLSSPAPFIDNQKPGLYSKKLENSPVSEGSLYSQAPTDLHTLAEALEALRHAMEMFLRESIYESAHRRLGRLANRLLKIITELKKLNPAQKWTAIGPISPVRFPWASALAKCLMTRSPFLDRKGSLQPASIAGGAFLKHEIGASMSCTRTGQAGKTCINGDMSPWLGTKRCPLKGHPFVVDWLGRVALRVDAAIENADCVGPQFDKRRHA